ncbi:MAG: hypothetical protein IPH69_17325 [Bacteroidales bacterium]|nr:hypothetical protein [Bacteroidales bacterium]
MKKIVVLSSVLSVLTLFLQGQNISNYSYVLDNGIVVKTENCWNRVQVNSRYDTAGFNSSTKPLVVNISTVGDLISGSSYKVFSEGKEIDEQNLTPGTYSLKIVLNLSGQPGTISFDVGNVIIKKKTKTTVSVNVYEYQVRIEAVQGNQKGLSYYTSTVNRYKGNNQQNLNWGLPRFYPKGNHAKAIPPDEPMGDYYGKIKPGTYDVLIAIEIKGKLQKVWLENFEMKPDMSYKIFTNLNGGEITYTGGVYEVKILHLYPSGTAATQKGKATRLTKLEIISYEPATHVTACPPGTYDVLVNYGNGVKYEWRKGIIIKTGEKTEVK